MDAKKMAFNMSSKVLNLLQEIKWHNEDKWTECERGINTDWMPVKILWKHLMVHLAPPDLFLFPKLKFILKNTDLIWSLTLKNNVAAVLNIISEDGFAKCCHSLYNHCGKCIWSLQDCCKGNDVQTNGPMCHCFYYILILIFSCCTICCKEEQTFNSNEKVCS
jgi:hypothetical protein